MASPIRSLNLVGRTGAYRSFAVLARVKKLKDYKASGGENEIKDLFLAVWGNF